MKNINIITSFLLLCTVPAVGHAAMYGDYYGEQKAVQEYGNYTQKQQNTKKTTQSAIPLRFFIELDTPVIWYQNTKVTNNAYGKSVNSSTTNINYNVLNNSAFVFGIETKNDFRLAFDAQHVQSDVEGDPNAELNGTSIGARLDVPFVKDLKTSPFLRLGLQYVKTEIKADDEKDSINGVEYYAGFGLKHNFSDNIYGTISATYGFSSKMKSSTFNVSCEYDLLNLNLGFGYRF